MRNRLKDLTELVRNIKDNTLFKIKNLEKLIKSLAFFVKFKIVIYLHNQNDIFYLNLH